MNQDYEYASYNPVAFDIANHFCEMTADYHSEEPHLLNFALYPGMFAKPDNFRLPWVSALQAPVFFSCYHFIPLWSVHRIWHSKYPADHDERSRFLRVYLEARGNFLLVNLFHTVSCFMSILNNMPSIVSGIFNSDAEHFVVILRPGFRGEWEDFNTPTVVP